MAVAIQASANDFAETIIMPEIPCAPSLLLNIIYRRRGK